ncbi:MAG: ABC transporter permease [Actinobacteria bacterium]|nr:MAG: ABC transporter permease [Actinomycetota bacterium]
MSPRLARIIKKEFLQMRRDRGLLPLLVVLPLVQLLLFGYVVSTDIRHLSTVVLDRDKSSESRRLVTDFSNAGYFDINHQAENSAGIRRLLDSGEAIIALVIPEGYAEDIAAERPATVQLILDGTESQTSSIARSYANLIVGRASRGLAEARVGRLEALGVRPPAIEPRVRVLFNPDMKSVNFFVPGLMAFIMTISAVLLTSAAIVRERDQGTLEQLIVTPIRRWELIVGKLFPYTVVVLVQITVIFIVGVFWFRVPFRGNVFFLYATALLFLVTNLGQGLFVSTISKTTQQATLTSYFLIFPAMLISGFVFPVENMPAVIQVLSYAVPLKYYLVIVRSIFLKGAGPATLWPQILALAVFAVVIFGLSASRFQKKFAD